MACTEISLWGEALPNWLSAVGTNLAVLAAVGLALMERRRAKKAEGERDTLRTELDSAVASRVAGRLKRVTTELREGRSISWASPEKWLVTVRNASDGVVTNVNASVVHADGGLTEPIGSWDVLLPQDSVEKEHRINIESYNENPYVQLTFTDPAGRRWSRGKGGRLEQVDGDQ